MNYSALRNVLKAGSIVFGASALFLLVLPDLFLDLLGLSQSDEMAWAMRMTRQHLIDLAEILGKYNYSKLAQMVDKVVALRVKFMAKGKTLTARDVAQNCHGVKTAAEARGLLSLCEEIYPAAKPSTPPAANSQQMKQAA